MADAARTKRLSSKLSGDLIALATRLSATASATFARMGLGSIEARVLTALADDAQTSAQISKVIGVDRAAVCRSVQALIDRDLVTKLDGRARLISLTGHGRALIADIERVSCEREQRLFAGFGDMERVAVLAFLGRLMLNVPDLIELAESGVFQALRSLT